MRENPAEEKSFHDNVWRLAVRSYEGVNMLEYGD